MPSPLLRDLSEGTLTLTLNRPSRRNALNAALIAELRAALAAARADAEVKVIVLAAEGDRAFCAGADLDPAALAGGPLKIQETRRDYAALLLDLGRCGKPVIAKVQAPAVAGGVGLVLAADLAIACDAAYLQLPELKVGIFPMMVSALLVRHVGRKRALELLFIAERLDAAEARLWGIYNKVVAPGELDAEVASLASRLGALSPTGMTLGKDAFYQAEDQPLADALAYLCSELNLVSSTDDAAEGLSAFIEKRAPKWS